MTALLRVENLNVSFDTHDGLIQAVNGLSFELEKGRTLGIVGESGSGKSQAVLALMGLLANNGKVTGTALFKGQSLLGLKKKELNRIRGNRIAMIFQDPMTSLNPYLTIGSQLSEVLECHQGLDRQTARLEALKMLDAVQISDAANRFDCYPHEFSGGMRQRILIAMALLCKPDLVIADEPTTALDVTVQAQIMALLSSLQEQFNMAMILITHDFGIVAGGCHEVMVMYGGRVMERAGVDDLFAYPQHPYTRGLLASLPRVDQATGRDLYTIPGEPPNPLDDLKGCPFAPRCQVVRSACWETPPMLEHVNLSHEKACYWQVFEGGEI